MSIFNEKLIKALFSREYICPECGGKMEFEDEWEETLICPDCGHDMDLDRYGFDSDEDYNKAYPSKEDVLGASDDE